MGRPGKTILDRLGPAGLNRALDDLLDQKQLVHLANACGVKYPGMRTQSQKRDRLLSDLVAEAGKQVVARTAILRTLHKETLAARREWAKLDPEQKSLKLCDEEFLQDDGNLGRMLYLIAEGGDGSVVDGHGDQLAHQFLVRIASNGSDAAPKADLRSREETRLKRRVASLEKKITHLESQLGKARESQKTFKRDLIERKGELAESRMLAERLRRELAIAEKSAAQATSAGRQSLPDKTFTDLGRKVSKLVADQNKLRHLVEKLPRSPASAASDARTLAPLTQSIKEVEKQLARQQTDQKEAWAAQAKLIDELRADVRSGRSSVAPPSKTRRSHKRQEHRVGVFIDVQNMYYAARQLKGKLDFDALLDAAVHNRRLIQATAYVVESAENDQSHFIAMLQQRGITVQRKALRVRADGSMKGNWDMELALDILDAAPSLDVVVLVSGDGDSTSLVKRVKAMGPRVEVIAFPRNTAKALVGAADRFQPLDRKFMIYAKRKVAKTETKSP